MVMNEQIQIHRDKYGIPHIEASSESDIWFGMGYASAADRLWQMEWYRRRGTGRWSEVVGSEGLEADKLFRQFGLDVAAQVDTTDLSDETQLMFQRYADGVNAFAKEGQLPPEYELAGINWEPWEMWHSILVFKVRHVIMGKQLSKIARLDLLNRLGAEQMALLDGEPAGRTIILPPGGVGETVISLGREEFQSALENLGTLAIEEGGSNSWAVHGSRTESGRPIVCNDSHRPLDVPNVYWQCHVICPEFNVAGAAFPGVPAYPHFGFNGSVVWNITHGSADYTDLWVEEFRESNGILEYKSEENWIPAEIRTVAIDIKDASPYEFELVRTARGSVMHGQPRQGAAIVMRYTATDQINKQWECLRPMLWARDVHELNRSQELWEEPVNNLVSGDTSDNISYLFRGRIPIRSDVSGRILPSLGSANGGIWVGDVPRDALPQATNPSEGFIATSNQNPWTKDEPFLSHEFSPASRAERLSEALSVGDQWRSDEVIALQADTVSVPARRWANRAANLSDLVGNSERARVMLSGWDGDLSINEPHGLLYSCFREAMIEAIYRPLLGDATWEWVNASPNATAKGIVSRWFYGLGITIADMPSPTTADGRDINSLMADVLAIAWSKAEEIGGEDLAGWRWGLHHQTAAKHTLSTSERSNLGLNPPAAEMGGDGDTVQVSSISAEIEGEISFPVGALSVYRQVVDFSNPEDGLWIIPGGASGIPGSPHYSDQLDLWANHQLIPMNHATAAARSAAVSTQTIDRT